MNRYSIAIDIQFKDDHQLEIVSKKHHIDKKKIINKDVFNRKKIIYFIININFTSQLYLKTEESMIYI